MRASFVSLGLALLGATAVAAADQPTCSLEKKCPEDTPCCSQYGNCGVGAYCLGGCDPRMSHSLDSCVPAPVCESRKMKMDSTDRIVDVSKYYGDASKADWMAQGEPVEKGGNVLLTMPKGSVGTVLASTVYMWYGKVKAKVKSSRGAGVVTGFILLSDVKDEIDYEWVGADLETVQTNYYFQGIPLYTESKNLSLSDTFDNWHTYEIDWTPDKITWSVNGQVGRVKERKDTWNKTAQQWDYPQTPSRVQLSIWPGGLESNPKGTIDWAGGVIDWDHEDIKKAGYYYASFAEVEIECWDGDRDEPGSNRGKSYYYDDVIATNDTVVDSNKDHILKSFEGTGLDMDKEDKSTKTTSSSKPSSTSDDDDDDDDSSSSGSGRIPGGTTPGGQNPGGNEQAAPDSGDGSGGGNYGSGNGCNAMEFSQDEDNCGSGSSSAESNDSDGGDDSSSMGAWGQDHRMAGASAFAALIAVAGLFWI